MKRDFRKFEPKFENLIQQFLKTEITAEQFGSDFTILWMNYRDEELKIEETWDKRYDLEILEQLQKGALTKEEYSQKFQELYGFSNEEYKNFCDMVDAMHSACSVYNPLRSPMFKWEITEEQFRAEVQELFAKYQNKK